MSSEKQNNVKAKEKERELRIRETKTQRGSVGTSRSGNMGGFRFFVRRGGACMARWGRW